MPKSQCLCAFKPSRDAGLEFWLLTHPEEFYKPTNTGRLIADSLTNTRRFSWQRCTADPELARLLDDPHYQPCLIFPPGPDYQQRLTTPALFQRSPAKIPALIILDGTWRQARRMFRLSRYLQHLPILPVPAAAPSCYQLRQSADPAHLCTAEAAVRLLERLGEADNAQVLQAYFELFNQAYASARYGQREGVAPAREKLVHLLGLSSAVRR